MKLIHFSGLFLIPLFPLIGAFYAGAFGLKIHRRFGEKAIHFPTVILPWCSFVVAVAAVIRLATSGHETALVQHLWQWLHFESLDADLAFQMDRLSAVMVLVVTFVGSLIHVYSIGYMHDDPSYWRFFSYLNLFMFSMLTLVLADNFLLMFVGWEGVGLCSYLLISFWYTDVEKAKAGMKAFVVNRIGDAGFSLGLFLVFWGLFGVWTHGEINAATHHETAAVEAESHDGEHGGALSVTSVKFREVERILHDPARREAFTSQHWGGVSLVTLACILLFVGATGKSAQIPLYVWLPDAMAGPTPVSALIHAATMVTAGVYMVARLHFLFALSPVAMSVVATTGAATALFAATIGLFQYDIKKVLAYSTVSQLGFMFVAVGVGAYWVGIFHLMTHAFFKACLFLGSGSVIMGCHHEQDMRKMGGLRKLMPITAITYLLSCCAIAGFPFFSGFFSKDEILWKAFTTGNLAFNTQGFWLWMIAAVAALCTSFYMFRSYYMTFSGEYRGGHAAHGHDGHDDHDAHDAHGHSGAPHESPVTMTAVLSVLAFMAVVGGYIGLPHLWHMPNFFEAWLEPIFEHTEHALHWAHKPLSLEWGLMAFSIVVAFTGFFAARWLYRNNTNPIPGKLVNTDNKLIRGVHQFVFRKYMVDEAYQVAIIDNTIYTAKGLSWFDKWIVDGIVNLCGLIGRTMGMIQGFIDRVFVDGLVNLVAEAILFGGRHLRKVQTGRIQSYVYALVGGALAVVVFMYAIT